MILSLPQEIKDALYPANDFRTNGLWHYFPRMKGFQCNLDDVLYEDDQFISFVHGLFKFNDGNVHNVVYTIYRVHIWKMIFFIGQ